MPELPEVETVRQVLRAEIIGNIIREVEIYELRNETKKRKSLIKEIDEEDFVNLLKNKIIYEIERKGKWLFFILTDQKNNKAQVLISHLGMAGKYFIEEKLLTFEQKKLFKKYNKESSKGLVFYLGDNQSKIKLIYCDARRIGSGFRLQKFDDYKKLAPYKNIGTDLLEERVDTRLLFEHYQKRKVYIKTALLEQKIISGIGNIYASEILFDTKIHPFKKTNQLTETEVKNIVVSAQFILKKALKLGGTSEFDFVNPLSKEGSYQNNLKVYNKEGEICPNNCGSLIENLAENKLGEPKKRGTFFCPNCQKLEV